MPGKRRNDDAMQQDAPAERKRRQKEKGSPLLYLLYSVFIVLIIAYVVYGSALIAVLAFIMLVVILVMEFRYSVKSEGMTKSVKDVGIALGAVIAFWVALIVLLQTTAPINVVASCSMLPVMHRGDLVVLHGVGNVTSFLESNHVPIINVSQDAYDRMRANISSEFSTFYAYNPGDLSQISLVVNGSNYNVGLYNESCLLRLSYDARSYEYSQCFVPAKTADRQLIRYNYSTASIVFSNSNSAYNVIYTSSISIGNVTIPENYSNPIIVYQTVQNDSFTGDIVHRLWAAIRVNGTYYFLTKGDNNPYLDLQAANYPSDPKHLVGYVVASAPYLGYLNLIIFHPSVPPGCNQTIVR